jgi:hypothetical protein
VLRWNCPSHDPKKNSRLRAIGPPSVAPAMCAVAGVLLAWKYGRAFRASLL